MTTMERNRYFLIGCMLLFSTSLYAADYQSNNILEVAGNAHALPPDFYGFNEEHASGNFQYNDPSYLQQLTELSPKSLRFPGGTLSNFYHWKIGNTDAEEVNDISNKRMRGRLVSANKLLSASDREISFDEFMQACQQKGISAYVVLNLYTGSVREAEDMVRYARKKGYKVAGWELGNELYMDVYKDRIPDVQSYIQRAKKFTVAIRRADPRARIGIVAAPSALTNYIAAKKEWDAWNHAIARENFYDAYVAHHYFAIQPKMTGQHLADYALAMATVATEKRMSYYREIFAQRPMWLTEWNWMGFQSKQANDLHLNTLFLGSMLIQLLQYPEIKVAMYHQLASAGRWPALFYDAKFLLRHADKKIRAQYQLPKSCQQSESCVLRSALFYPFWLFSQTMNDSDRVTPLRFFNTATRHFRGGARQQYDLEYPLLQAVALGDENSVRHVLLTNLDSQVQRIDVSVLGQDNGQLQCVIKDRLDDNSDNSSTPEENALQRHIASKPVSGSMLSLPGYSFCLFDS